MDQSYSESDVSLSPTQVLERLQVLRQLQLIQQGKLQKQRLQYQGSPETLSSVTEIVSHFSNSTSYNTFRSILQSSSNEVTPRSNVSNLSQKVSENDLIEGVSVLNISQESEFITNSPVSTRSRLSAQSRTGISNRKSPSSKSTGEVMKPLLKKQIALDDMPILSPKKDFESLIIEKLKSENNIEPNNKVKKPNKIAEEMSRNKKPFLKKGEGIARIGLKKSSFVIQNTKSLPWRCKSIGNKVIEGSKLTKPKNNSKLKVELLVPECKSSVTNNDQDKTNVENIQEKSKEEQANNSKRFTEQTASSSNHGLNNAHVTKSNLLELPKGKHPLKANKGKTWAAVLTKEQDDFLRQLKQSDYYKNFVSPAKSTISDASCDETLSKLKQEREIAEQNMFELLESKVSHESFTMENSFLNKFLKRNLECSGESTPLVMQKCLADNPKLMHIFPDLRQRKRNESLQSDIETCNSECTECCNEVCSSPSSCCSCKTVEEINDLSQSCIQDQKKKNTGHINNETNKSQRKEVEKLSKNDQCQNVTAMDHNADMKANMTEMNAKLIATSELLKDRLHELEDEIETFRKENANLTKMREEIDCDRQKFYEEKAAFEQKFNEEKILSEYYLAEEKEKLNKQKQMYERYVREMRGRLNKKDKDEVINLKKEINDLKEDIRIKDAKSTSTIARLRNQIKIIEKEKKELQNEVEKLKKENKRIQHSNDITRRLTNIKYLEEINKKLSHMTAKNTQSDNDLDKNIKYKAFEIERQSRSRRAQPVSKNTLRPRAKSVPNLNVTSRYAKYFSQRDVVSEIEKTKSVNVDQLNTLRYMSDIDKESYGLNSDDTDGESIEDNDFNNDENNLEKIYKERFHAISPNSNRTNVSTSSDRNLSERYNIVENVNDFFIHKSNSYKNSLSPNISLDTPYSNIQSSSNSTISKTPVSILSRKSPTNFSSHLAPNLSGGSNRSKSSINSNHTSGQISPVIINTGSDQRMTVSPEPSTSKTSLTKTNLNPTEIRKPDGTRELKFPNGNVKYISADGKYTKFVYYNGDVKENFYDEGRIKYFYAETKTYHTTHADGLEVLEFSDGQVEKRYKDGSSEIRLPNGSIRYSDPKNEHVREEWRFPDGTSLTVSANGDQRIVFSNGQVEVHTKDHKRREFPDGTVKLVYNDGTAETRYASGRVRIKDKHGNLIMDSAPG